MKHIIFWVLVGWFASLLFSPTHVTGMFKKS